MAGSRLFVERSIADETNERVTRIAKSLRVGNSLDPAVRRANRTDYGLAAGVWTTNLASAHQMSRALRERHDVGKHLRQFDPAVPFGGYRASDWGREFGAESLEDYLNTKSVWMSVASPDFST